MSLTKLLKSSLFSLIKPGTDTHKIDLYVKDDDTIYGEMASTEFVCWLNAK